MATLDQNIAALAPEGDDFVIDAPEDWAQGRTLYGGMTAALSWGAIGRAQGDLGPLRSAQFSFVGPATGRLRFTASVLRRGRSSAVADVDCRNADGLAARSMFVFGAARESRVAHDFTPRMDVPAPDRCAPFHTSTKPLPGFLGRYEYRLAAGARLFETDKRPEFAVWVRLRDGPADDRVAALLAVADALPGAAMANFPAPAPLSTMTWTVDFHQPLAEPGDWYLVWSSSEKTAEGYSLQDMRVYSEAGEPLVSARQMVAIFI
jgi:acyl-CoA thioesterase